MHTCVRSRVFFVCVKVCVPFRLLLLKEEAEQYRDMAIFPESAALPESEHLLYQLGWAQATFSYHYLLRTKDRSGGTGGLHLLLW